MTEKLSMSKFASKADYDAAVKAASASPMNLTELKAAAETAKTSPAELELWQMEISPDDVLRLVEVARAAKAFRDATIHFMPGSGEVFRTKAALDKILEDVTP